MTFNLTTLHSAGDQLENFGSGVVEKWNFMESDLFGRYDFSGPAGFQRVDSEILDGESIYKNSRSIPLYASSLVCPRTVSAQNFENYNGSIEKKSNFSEEIKRQRVDLSLETPNYKKFKLEFKKTAGIKRELKRAIKKNISPVKISPLKKQDTIQEEQDSWEEEMTQRSTGIRQNRDHVRQKSDAAPLKAQQLLAFNNFSQPATSSRTNKSQDL